MTKLDTDVASQTRQLLAELAQIAETDNQEQMSLPPATYSSQGIFEIECEKIFRPNWIMIGRLDQVPKPGDFLSVDLLNEKLVITRDAVGEVHVMSRICTHRWMEVCVGEGNAKALECPYHAWKFNLDGSLRSAPQMKDSPCFESSQLGLQEIRFEVWQGFVFVNLDGKAEPLGPRLVDLDAEIKEYNLAEWKTVWTRDYGVMPWDWKVMQDNGDCYHHIGLHRNTLYDLWPNSLIWNKPNNGHYTLTGCGTAPDVLEVDEEGGLSMPGSMPRARGLTPFQKENLLLIYIHPNYFIGPTPDATLVARVFPVGPGRVRFITDVLAPPNALDDPEFAKKVADAGVFLDTINVEDTRACTSVQEGSQSQWAKRSPLSSEELCVAQFAAWFSRHMTA
jgi:phenylpropionate dioxygenase-like ring-hydroxylating dioxygenase large terminal subunit